MRHIFLLLLLISSAAFSQGKNISVISLEKVNIVYRGITNPIKIAVPGAKSYKAEAPGTLEKVDSLGNYLWNVTGVSGTKGIIKITATMPDDSVIHEEKEFEIRAIPPLTAYINSNHSGQTYEITHKQLEKLDLKTIFQNFNYVIDSTYGMVRQFSIQIQGEEPISIKGNQMNANAYSLLKNLPVGTEFLILDINTKYYINWANYLRIRLIENDKNEPRLDITTKFYSNNILYRGIDNELKIEYPNAKYVWVNGPGLRPVAEDSTYTINVTNIKEDRIHLDFEITTQKDSVYKGQEVLYIKDITPKKITLNDKSCNGCIIKMTLEELKNAIIDIRIDDIQETWANCSVWGFQMKTGNITIVEDNGNSISDEVLTKLSKLPKKSIIEVTVPAYECHGFTYDPPPLKLMLIN